MRLLPPTTDHFSQEQIASAEAARIGLPHTGWLKSLTLSPPLSYKGGQNDANNTVQLEYLHREIDPAKNKQKEQQIMWHAGT